MKKSKKKIVKKFLNFY